MNPETNQVVLSLSAFSRPECNKETAKRVVRKVSLGNLGSLQLHLIDHQHKQGIIEFISTRSSYAFAQHDHTVHFWFITGHPSWEKLTSSLNTCNEDYLAYRIKNGDIFRDSDPEELDGVHRPFKLEVPSITHISERPHPKPATREGKAIVTKSFHHLEAGYKGLKFKIFKLLEEKKIHFKDFLKHANCFFSKEIEYGTDNIEKYLENAQQFRELGMWHYDLLEDTLKLLLDDDEERILLLFNDYESKLNEYLMATRIVEFLKSKDKEHLLHDSDLTKEFNIQNRNSYKRLGMKIDVSIQEKSLRYIERLWNSLRGMFHTPAKAVLEYIREACIEVAWLVPNEVANSLSESAQKSYHSYFIEAKIRTVWIDEECIYHKNIHTSKNKEEAQFCLWQACEYGRLLEVKAMLEAPSINVNLPSIIDGKTPLMLASQNGFTEIVDILLQRDALPNLKEDRLGRSAIFFAVEMGHEEVVKILLEQGADILMMDKSGSTVLDIVKESSAVYQFIYEATKVNIQLLEACETGNLQKVHSLVQLKTTNIDSIRSDGKTPLMLSVQHGFGEIIEFLLSCEANVLIADNNGHIAVDTIKGSPKALKYLREETMFSSAAKGNVAVLKKTLDLNTDPNTRENDECRFTPLLWSCKTGRHESVELLLQYGADPNAESSNNWNGLSLACRFEHYEIVKTLLSRSIDINKQTEDGWTALMLVATHGNKEIAELLLKRGANPYLQDKDGFTPLIQAAQNGHYEIVKLLAESSEIHVDKYTTKDPHDWSPIMFATKNGHTDLVKYFVDKGADIHRQKAVTI